MKTLLATLIAALLMAFLVPAVLAQEGKVDTPPTGKAEQDATTGEGEVDALQSNNNVYHPIPPAPPACIPGTTSYANNTPVSIPQDQTLGQSSGPTSSTIIQIHLAGPLHHQ